ncbi:cytochrome ubiquinol oxidase subunit I [Streptosporangium sp. KLBMP 9127]|nr:cytochrome ubiquinol oxidase subunit I [Streptosporangium sp. KLBMP 9127]
MHFLFVSLSLGLVAFLIAMQTAYVITGNAVFERMVKFWGRLYVINYGVGIISGIVMEFQFGLNWSGLTAMFGDVFGGALALETLVAFFVEATLLGAWIFGWGVLGRKTHLALLWLIGITAYISAFWILTANAFLQHPVGHEVSGGRGRLVDFGALLNNPNLWDAFSHVVFVSLIVGSMFVAGVSAWHFIRRTEHVQVFGKSLRMALAVLPFAVFGTIHFGMLQVVVIGDTQPLKRAVIDADTAGAADLQAQMVARFGPGDYIPPDWVGTLFEVMLNGGFGLMLLSMLLAVLLIRSWVIRLRVPLYLLVALIPLPFALVVAGWLVREVGRQPWTVYQLLTTEQAMSDLPPAAVLGSFVAFTTVLLVLAAVNYTLIARFAGRGPQDDAFGTSLDAVAPAATTV